MPCREMNIQNEIDDDAQNDREMFILNEREMMMHRMR